MVLLLMQNLNEVPRKNITSSIHSGTKHLPVAYKLPRTEAKDCWWHIVYFYYLQQDPLRL
jgi:hypothetical protein